MRTKMLQKQLVAAVAMVIIAAIAVSSATYAWFASGATAHATDMSVSVRSDARYMEIRNSSQSFDDDTPRTTTTAVDSGIDIVAGNPVLRRLLPTRPVFSEGALSKWQYGYSSSVSSSAVNTAGYTDVPPANLSNYVLINDFYFRSTVEDETLVNLRVNEVTVENDAVANSIDEAVRVLIIGANGYSIWDAGTKTLTTDNVLVSSLPYVAEDQPGQHIAIYVYYDGDDEKLYTDNLTTLAGMKVNVSFRVDLS